MAPTTLPNYPNYRTADDSQDHGAQALIPPSLLTSGGGGGVGGGAGGAGGTISPTTSTPSNTTTSTTTTSFGTSTATKQDRKSARRSSNRKKDNSQDQGARPLLPPSLVASTTTSRPTGGSPRTWTGTRTTAAGIFEKGQLQEIPRLEIDDNNNKYGRSPPPPPQEQPQMSPFRERRQLENHSNSSFDDEDDDSSDLHPGAFAEDGEGRVFRRVKTPHSHSTAQLNISMTDDTVTSNSNNNSSNNNNNTGQNHLAVDVLTSSMASNQTAKEESKDMQVTSPQNPARPPPENRTKRRWMVPLVVILILVVGLGAGLGVGLSNSESKEKTNDKSLSRPEQYRLWLQEVTTNEDLVWDDSSPSSSPQLKALEWILQDTFTTDLIDSTDFMVDASERVLDKLKTRYVLAILYYGTGGPSRWIQKALFLEPIDECDWVGQDVGVTCNDLQQVVGLSFAKNNLASSLPPFTAEWNALIHLEQLDLSGNQLTGSLPVWSETLPNLLNLTLSNNFLEGPIRIPSTSSASSWLTQYPKSAALTYLDLSDNQLSGGIPFDDAVTLRLSNLTHLMLGNNKLFEFMTDLEFPPLLQELDLKGNELEGQIPQHISQLSRLQRLDLSDNSLGGPMGNFTFENLSVLDSLHLQDNLFSGTFPWSTLANKNHPLRFLFLSGNEFSGTVPWDMVTANLTSLTDILLSGSGLVAGILPDESIGQLSNLVSVDLGNTKLTGTIPTSMGRLHKLNYLSLVGNLLTGSVPSSLGSLSSLGE